MKDMNVLLSIVQGHTFDQSIYVQSLSTFSVFTSKMYLALHIID